MIRSDRVRIYVGLKDKDNRMSNLDMVPYKALFLRWMREVMPVYFDCSTVFDGVGMWKTTEEETRVIELIVPARNDIAADKVKLVAMHLKDLLNQDAVMVTVEPIHMEMV